MKLIKGGADFGPTGGDFTGEVRIDGSICYDFVVSLRALFNPRTFTRSRKWAATRRPQLDEAVVSKGRFFFQGFDTALGYGAARVVQRLPEQATPADLIDAVSEMAPTELAMFMLDTGESSNEQLAQFNRVLAGDTSRLDDALDGLPAGWAARCRRVLGEPEAVRADLVEVLKAHLTEVYAHHMASASESIATSVPEAHKLLDVLPATDAIERLTGGYTVGSDLGLHTIILAPSVFIYPFMSTRIDEENAEALILYGVPSDIFDAYDPVPIQNELVTALKAMSDPNRLAVLQLLADQSMYTAELVRQLGLAQTTVHHHLAQLRAAGLIRQKRDRNGMKYSVRTDSAIEMLRALEELILGSTTEESPTKEA